MSAGMTLSGWALIATFVALCFAMAKPVGLWLHALYEGRDTPLSRVLGPVERGFYRLSGIDPAREQTWRQYAVAMLLFQVVTALLTYAVLRLQGVLPLNPRGLPGLSPDLAMNTAISFVTNTNWQAYAGEATLSNLSQMFGLVPHNFLSAATGIAVAFALFRGFARRQTQLLGNFWADMTRVTLYLLLPIACVYALVLVAGGVPQTFVSTIDATTLEGAHQTLVMGPIASQEAIKMIGTNGGGFFNVNSAHPFENPSALINALQMLSIFAIGCRSDLVFRQGGRRHPPGLGDPDRDDGAVRRRRQRGLLARGGRQSPAPPCRGSQTWRARSCVSALPPAPCSPRSQPPPVAARSTACTTASCRWAGWCTMFNIELGEIVVGGVGSGIYGFLLFALLAVFIAGADGRAHARICRQENRRPRSQTGRAGDRRAALVHSRRHRAVERLAGRLAGLGNKGPHGFSELLYAFTSATGNNGSAFGGLSANTPYFNGALAVAMWIGRFFMMVPVLAIAGSLAQKKHTPEIRRIVSHHGPAVDRPAGRDHIDCGRPDIPARARAWPHCRTHGDAGRHDILRRHHETMNRPHQHRCFRARLVIPAIGEALRKLHPRALVRKPGDVHHCGRCPAADRAAGPRPVRDCRSAFNCS